MPATPSKGGGQASARLRGELFWQRSIGTLRLPPGVGMLVKVAAGAGKSLLACTSSRAGLVLLFTDATHIGSWILLFL